MFDFGCRIEQCDILNFRERNEKMNAWYSCAQTEEIRNHTLHTTQHMLVNVCILNIAALFIAGIVLGIYRKLHSNLGYSNDKQYGVSRNGDVSVVTR